MNNTSKAILFCHYGDSPYLEHTLRQVKLTNPENRIVLLGDEKNKAVAQNVGIEHVFFSDYGNTVEILTFEKVYQHVAGKNHGREYWTKFVFKRWFHIHEFIKKEGINSFWHFDSDNMILASLNDQEHKFIHFDCTEQCNGICMNGYISSFSVVDGYVKKINDLFANEKYLAQQREDFVTNPSFAFTEMRAYNTYKDQENIKSRRLNKIIDNESFDDCICQEHGYELYEFSINGFYLKKLYTDVSGNFYCYHLSSSKYIKMNSLNLSWVPIRLFELVFEISTGTIGKELLPTDTDNFSELDLSFLTKFSFKSAMKGIIPAIVKRYLKSVVGRFFC